MSFLFSRSRPYRAVLTTTVAVLLTSASWAADVTLRGNDPIDTNSFSGPGTAPNGWNDNAAPSAGNNYFTGAFQLRSPVGTAAATFAGDSLSIDAGGSLLFKGSGIYTINNLILNGGALIHGDTAIAAPNNIATLAGSITIAAASTIDTTANANRIITVNSAIHGSGPLTIQGTNGAVNFTNTANDFTGPLTLSGSSALVIGALTNGGVASAMGAATADAANLIFNGGTLRINGATPSSTDRQFTLNTTGGTIDSSHATAAVNFTHTGAITLNGTGNRTLTLTGASTGANTLAGILGDNGGATSLTKAGAGLWVLTAANTYTGATNINGGTLAFTNLNNLGAGTAVNMGGGSLRWDGANDVDITSVRTVTFTAGNNGFNTNGRNITFAGSIGGAGGFVKQGNGVATLSAANTFTGNVSVGNSAGAIRVTNSQSLGVGVKTITVTGNQGGVNAPSLVLAPDAGSIVLPGSFAFTTSNDGLNGNPTAPALINESGNNTINGNFTLTDGGGGTRFLINGGSLILNGSMTPNRPSRTALFSGAGNGAANGVIDGIGANAVAVVKDGTGTWVLNGANLYTGATAVNAGTLLTSTASSGGGAVTVANGGTFGVRVAAAGQTFNASTLTLAAGSTGLALNLGNFGNSVNPVVNTLTFTPNGAVTLTVKGSNLAVGTPIRLIDYGTLAGAGFASLNLALPLRTTGALVNNTLDGRIDLTLTAFDLPRWTGASDGNWDTTTPNWREVNTLSDTTYIQDSTGSDSVLFDDNANGTTTVNLTTTLTPSSVVVNNTTKSYTFVGSGKLSGSGDLLKQGTGTLVIANSGTNDYTGTTTISGGALQVGDGVTAGAGQLGSGLIINEATLLFERPDNFEVSNVISGSGPVAKNGAGVMTLLSNNTFSGELAVNAGTVRLGSANALGATSFGTTVQAGATLDINSVLVPAGEVVTITGAGVGDLGAVVNNGLAGGPGSGLKGLSLTGNATIGGTQRWDIRDVVGGLNGNSFTLTKVGSAETWFKDLGETTLGGVVILQGLLGFEGSTTLGSATGNVQVAPTATLAFFNSVAPHAKTLELLGGRILAGAGTGTSLGGSILLAANSTIEAAANVTLTATGKIEGSSGFTKTGNGILELTGNEANVHAGTTIVSGGTLRLNKAGVPAIAGDVVVNTGTLALAAAEQFAAAASVTINNGGTWNNGTNTSQSLANFTVNTPTLQALNNLTVTNVLSITAGLHDVNSGQSLTANTLSISGGANFRLGANGNDSTVTIQAGGLILNNGTLQLGQAGGNVTALVNLGGDVTASGTSAITNPNTAGPRLIDLQGSIRTFDIVDGTTTVSPTIQNGGLTKEGDGTLVLTGASTYAGETTVNDGALIVNGSISGSGVLVSDGGTLGGTGTAGSLTVLEGGILAPGAGIGTLSVGELAFESNSIFSVELGGTLSDQVNGSGAVNLNGFISLSIALNSPVVDGLTYTLLNSSTGINGYAGGSRFTYGGNLLDEGEHFFVTSGELSQFFAISYAADGGTDVTLTVVPEPGSMTLLLGGVCLLGLGRTRRREA
jgi:fibronectin-binding autotransporter adhesin